MGNLEPWMNEYYLQELWDSLGERDIHIKLIHDKNASSGDGYAFIEFSSNIEAQRALATVHGTSIPHTNLFFRLNWASGSGLQSPKDKRLAEYSLFVGDLDYQVSEPYLLVSSFFQSRYPSCHSAKIVKFSNTGQSKGFGFIRFSNLREQKEALVRMNGVFCKSRPLRVLPATPKPSTLNHSFIIPKTPTVLTIPTVSLAPTKTHPTMENTTLFVGGLALTVTEEELIHHFKRFGDIIYVKIPQGKKCGFVHYRTRLSAELAIHHMNGIQIGPSRIRLSWGKSQIPQIPQSSSSPIVHQDKSAAAIR
ncbi:hypothetical protein BDF14DRAFT_1728427 [Spinellus fusiger]|nr:hypothetical protein BDF14DRAFT_1728427 [Spinellus fusiger]